MNWYEKLSIMWTWEILVVLAVTVIYVVVIYFSFKHMNILGKHRTKHISINANIVRVIYGIGGLILVVFGGFAIIAYFNIFSYIMVSFPFRIWR